MIIDIFMADPEMINNVYIYNIISSLSRYEKRSPETVDVGNWTSFGTMGWGNVGDQNSWSVYCRSL
jgi:hypothetical protein